MTGRIELLAITILLGTWTVPAGAEDAEHVYSVCELLASPQQFHGRTLKVRGIVEGGMEGAWLKSGDCPERFFVGENSLSKAISLSYQSAYGDAPPQNMAHIERVDQEIREKRRKAKSGVLLLTHAGILETRTDWILLDSGSGQKQLWGFGHLNTFPAQLVVTDLADPEIIAKKENRK